MSLIIGRKSSPLFAVAQWVAVGAIAAALLSSADIKRYLKIRSM